MRPISFLLSTFMAWFALNGVIISQDLNSANTLENLANEIEEGRQLILDYRFLPADFHQSTFDELWRDWPEPIRTEAEKASGEERLAMAFSRYGFSPRDDDPKKPLQFVVDKNGNWSMNCFACHGGKVAGQNIEGAPNSHIALATLYEDLLKTKHRLKVSLNQMDVGAMAVPMGTSRGTTNAVVFGITLMAYRDKHLNMVPFRIPRPTIVHHDMDAPAWWNVSKRDRLYIDGFVEKNPRALIPFVMDQRNRGRKLRDWENEFELVYKYIESLEPPKYPYEVDSDLASKGKVVFESTCADCHGTYGDKATYPSKIVDIETIGTDRVRLDALIEYDRQVYHESWFAHYGADDTVIAPKGYQAPPLDGIWASAPYFHNGSVPSIRQVLKPAERPKIWKRTEDGFDRDNVGLTFKSYDRIPKSDRRSDLAREYFDSTRHGKSAKGHDFGNHLTELQIKQLLEYLKTL